MQHIALGVAILDIPPTYLKIWPNLGFWPKRIPKGAREMVFLGNCIFFLLTKGPSLPKCVFKTFFEPYFGTKS